MGIFVSVSGTGLTSFDGIPALFFEKVLYLYINKKTMSKELREQMDKFTNLLRKRKIRVGDEVLCIKNYKFMKEISQSDYDYVSQTGDDEHIMDIVKGRTYLFEKGEYYKVVNGSENSVTIESDNGERQIFLLKSNLTKYENQYFPIFSEYFTTSK
jgi:hypothetical protein